MDTEYQLVEFGVVDNLHQNHLSQSFSWLNIFILYSPLWVKRTPNLEHRSCCLSLIILSITIIAILYHLAFVFIFYIYKALDGLIYQSVYSLSEIIVSSSRLFGLYYFYSQFNYPWNHSQLQSLNMKHIKIIKTSKQTILILFMLIMILDIIMAIHYAYGHIEQDESFYVSVSVIGRLFLFFPSFISFAVAAAIFLKYHLRIIQFTEKLQAGDIIDFNDMLQSYVKLNELFKCEYSVYLEWSLLLYLFGILLDIWVSSYEILSYDSWIDFVDVFEDIFVFVLYVISASWVGESFAKYESMLYKYGMDNKKSINYNEFHYLLVYVSRYRLQVRLGRVTITKFNAIKFVVVFCVAKLMSYTVRYISG